MKNFGILYQYELKKLLKRKLSWVAVLVLAGFCVFGVFDRGACPAGYIIPTFDENGNETGEERYISGEEIYTTYLKTAGTLDGRIMDDTLFQEMLENLPNLEDLDLQLYFYTEDATYMSVYTMAEALLQNPRSVTAEEFYASQWEHTRSYCEKWGSRGQSQGVLSTAEIDHWMEQVAKIERPFVYRDSWQGTSFLMEYCFILQGLLPVAGAVCVCTIFSDDRRNRMDALVFTTRKCRVPLYLAKILAGAVMAALAGLVIVLSVVTAFLAIWGTHGLDASFQMYYVANPRPGTIWQVLLPILALLVLYTLLCGGVTMLVSALTRSSIMALVVPVLLAQVLGRIHQYAYGWAGYLPENLMGWNGLHNVDLVNVFGVYLNNLQFGPLLYLAITMLLLALCWLGWRRSAVGRI